MRFAEAFDGFVESWPLFIYSLTWWCLWRLLNERLCWGVNCTWLMSWKRSRAGESMCRVFLNDTGHSCNTWGFLTFHQNTFLVCVFNQFSVSSSFCFLLSLNHSFSSSHYLPGPKSMLWVKSALLSVKPRPSPCPPPPQPNLLSCHTPFISHAPPLSESNQSPLARPWPLESQSPPFSISPTLFPQALI